MIQMWAGPNFIHGIDWMMKSVSKWKKAKQSINLYSVASPKILKTDTNESQMNVVTYSKRYIVMNICHNSSVLCRMVPEKWISSDLVHVWAPFLRSLWMFHTVQNLWAAQLSEREREKGSQSVPDELKVPLTSAGIRSWLDTSDSADIQRQMLQKDVLPSLNNACKYHSEIWARIKGPYGSSWTPELDTSNQKPLMHDHTKLYFRNNLPQNHLMSIQTQQWHPSTS